MSVLDPVEGICMITSRAGAHVSLHKQGKQEIAFKGNPTSYLK